MFLDDGRDHVLLDDDRGLRQFRSCLLNVCPASGMQAEALRDTARNGLTSEVENSLQGRKTQMRCHDFFCFVRLGFLMEASADKALEDGASPCSSRMDS